MGSTGGAPLILVFLGAGLLVGAAFALMILRRFYPSRGQTAAALSLRNKEDKQLDEKPPLWDVQLELMEDGDSNSYYDAKWGNIKPLSAKFIPDHKIPPPAPLPLPLFAMNSIDSSADSQHSSRLSSIRHYLHLGRSHSPTESHKHSSRVYEAPAYQSERSGTLQVALAIEMPHQRRGGRDNSETEFCLGLSSVPWDEGMVNSES
ncbi:hypothetical protein BXZ70DRAFT_955808 [Cristinia sonorae]|uniref:Uncharacterized protein n=1 Tax=Cristinia sonorae TaxID=1940300 RepID=A0A8K0XLB6_9AGAR|nr:hypothetical protein BXZ70DRAFT_955808 [Cristinia sonorae]